MTEAAYSVRVDEPVSLHTALRTGGRCPAFIVAHDIAGLQAAWRHCKERTWPVHMIGAGTRVVARDGHVPNALIRLGVDFCFAREMGGRHEVGAAYPVPALVAYALANGNGGLVHASSVAGSMGASLVLDDGWDDVVRSVCVLRRGRPADVTLTEAKKMTKPCVLSAKLSLPTALVGEGEAILAARARGLGRPSGSWYVDPDGGAVRDAFANVVLQQVRLRRVMIPRAAPEMLVNLGGGTAEDLRLLGRSTMDRVKRVRGVSLREAYRWMGSASPVGRKDER